jgi:hypothetical protein
MDSSPFFTLQISSGSSVSGKWDGKETPKIVAALADRQKTRLLFLEAKCPFKN